VDGLKILWPGVQFSAALHFSLCLLDDKAKFLPLGFAFICLPVCSSQRLLIEGVGWCLSNPDQSSLFRFSSYALPFNYVHNYPSIRFHLPPSKVYFERRVLKSLWKLSLWLQIFTEFFNASSSANAGNAAFHFRFWSAPKQKCWQLPLPVNMLFDKWANNTACHVRLADEKGLFKSKNIHP